MPASDQDKRAKFVSGLDPSPADLERLDFTSSDRDSLHRIHSNYLNYIQDIFKRTLQPIEQLYIEANVRACRMRQIAHTERYSSMMLAFSKEQMP